MRKLKVNTKLAVRKVSRLDKIDKGGLIVSVFIILPAVLILITNVITNGANLI